jgi:hypothetical protein
MRRPFLPVALGLLIVLTLAAGSAAAATSYRLGMRLSELQVIGTHNSYHREISEREQDALRRCDQHTG